MKKTFYIQTDEINRITDVVSKPYEDYKPVELNTPLPPNILGRCYELLNESVIYRKEWDVSSYETRLQAQQQVMDDIVIAMLGGESNV